MWLKIINEHYHINSCNLPCPSTDSSPSVPQRTQAVASAALTPMSPLAYLARESILVTAAAVHSLSSAAGRLLEEILEHQSLQDPGESPGPGPCCSVLTYWCHHEAHGRSLLRIIKL